MGIVRTKKRLGEKLKRTSAEELGCAKGERWGLKVVKKVALGAGGEVRKKKRGGVEGGGEGKGVKQDDSSTWGAERFIKAKRKKQRGGWGGKQWGFQESWGTRWHSTRSMGKVRKKTKGVTKTSLEKKGGADIGV